MVGEHCRQDAAARRRLSADLRSRLPTGAHQIGLDGLDARGGDPSGKGGKDIDCQRREEPERTGGSTGCGAQIIIVTESWMVECCRAQRIVPVLGHTLLLDVADDGEGVILVQTRNARYNLC